MRYLVTGGAGFIGSHLCELLIASGHRVRVLDDFSTGRHENVSAGAHVITGDVADLTTVMHATEGVDGVFHLAAIASVQRCTEDLLGTHRTNVGGMLTLLDAIKKHGKHTPIVYASSAAVYGHDFNPPTTEYAKKSPMSAYGADKLSCELHASVATLLHLIPAIGMRFFNVYGPRQDPKSPYSGVISIFVDRALAEEPIIIHGDGEQTRDLVFVKDVARALQRAMMMPDTLKRVPGTVLNVCTGKPTSINDLATMIFSIVGKPVRIEHDEIRRGDIRHSCGDPNNMLNLLGMTDMTSLRKGLSQTI